MVAQDHPRRRDGRWNKYGKGTDGRMKGTKQRTGVRRGTDGRWNKLSEGTDGRTIVKKLIEREETRNWSKEGTDGRWNNLRGTDGRLCRNYKMNNMLGTDGRMTRKKQ